MSAIFKRDFSSYFNSAIGYVVLAVFYFFSAIYFYACCLYSDSSSLTNVVSSMFMIIVLIIPLITMRSFSEEKKQKTDQALLTSPVNLFEIVMGKFLASFVMYLLCIAIFVLYSIIIAFFVAPNWTIILCTLLGVILLGGALISIDIFISALTESQIISAIVSMAVGLFIFYIDSLASMTNSDFIKGIAGAVSFNNNYSNFTHGILGLSNVFFFISVIAIFVFLTIRVIEKKRWS